MSHTYTYSEIVTNDVWNRGTVYDVGSLLNLDYYGKPAPTNAYSNCYLFGEDWVTYKDSEGKRRGYNGPVKAEWVHFDFDDSFEPDNALYDAKKLIETVCSNDKYGVLINDIHVWFTGSKGFHVCIVTDEISQMPPSVDTPAKIKQIAKALHPCETADWSVYDRTRLWRIPNSRHGKTRLYKIPLLPMLLWTLNMAEIKQLATKQQRIEIQANEFIRTRHRN